MKNTGSDKFMKMLMLIVCTCCKGPFPGYYSFHCIFFFVCFFGIFQEFTETTPAMLVLKGHILIKLGSIQDAKVSGLDFDCSFKVFGYTAMFFFSRHFY